MIEFALKLVEEQLTERIHELTKQPLPPKELVLKILMETIPTGGDIEMQLWLEYILYKIRKNDLKSDSVYKKIATMMYKLHDAGYLRKDISLEEEIVYLHALVDGFKLHCLMGVVNLDEKGIEKLIKRELDRLFK